MSRQRDINILGSGSNVQVGDGNTQHVQQLTFASVLQQLADKVEKSDLPAAKKSGFLDALRELAAHPLTQTTIQVAAQIATQVPGGQ